MRFYNAKAGGGGHRRLVWQHSLSTCLVRAQFARGAKELSVSLAQVKLGVLIASLAFRPSAG